MNIDCINDKYLKRVKKFNPVKYDHLINVQKTAVELAKKHNINIRKAALTAIFHDCAKDFSEQKIAKLVPDYKKYLDKTENIVFKLWHAPLSAVIAKKYFKINDKQVLKAIRFHTTGKANMSKLEMLIYLADLIEPFRRYQGVENVRKFAFKSLYAAMEEALKLKITYVLKKKSIIHPNSISAWNWLIAKNS